MISFPPVLRKSLRKARSIQWTAPKNKEPIFGTPIAQYFFEEIKVRSEKGRSYMRPVLNIVVRLLGIKKVFAHVSLGSVGAVSEEALEPVFFALSNVDTIGEQVSLGLSDPEHLKTFRETYDNSMIVSRARVAFREYGWDDDRIERVVKKIDSSFSRNEKFLEQHPANTVYIKTMRLGSWEQNTDWGVSLSARGLVGDTSIGSFAQEVLNKLPAKDNTIAILGTVSTIVDTQARDNEYSIVWFVDRGAPALEHLTALLLVSQGPNIRLVRPPQVIRIAR